MVGAPPAIPENYVSSSPRELANVMGGGGRGSPPPPAFNYQQNGNAHSRTVAYVVVSVSERTFTVRCTASARE